MLSEERLSEIGAALRESTINEDGELADIKEIIEKIYSSNDYQKWLNGDQYSSYLSLRSRYELPDDFGMGFTLSKKRLLEKYSLLNGSQLTVKIDSHRGRVHLTDGNWVPSTKRVYPFSDESEQICKYVDSTDVFNNLDLLIDPACGCGHHALGTQKDMLKLCFDVSLRALAYGRLNAALVNEQDILFSDRDIHRGVHPAVSKIPARHALFAANMPFAIFPKDNSVKRRAQDGGERGIYFTKLAIQAFAELREKSVAEKKTGIILLYSLGNAKTNKWEAVEIAERIFGPKSFEFLILTDEQLWRVNGKKEQPNPMPIRQLHLKGRCGHTYAPDEMNKKVEGFRVLEREFEQNGYTHLAYGLLVVK